MSEREEVSICCARMCACWNAHDTDLGDLRTQLTTAERERDEARREREALRKQYAMSLEEQVELVRQREDTSSQLWDCMNERDAWKHRAEQAATVTEAMVEAAAKVGCDNGFDRDFDAPGMYWDAMHKVVTAALDASGRGDAL